MKGDKRTVDEMLKEQLEKFKDDIPAQIVLTIAASEATRVDILTDGNNSLTEILFELLSKGTSLAYKEGQETGVQYAFKVIREAFKGSEVESLIPNFEGEDSKDSKIECQVCNDAHIIDKKGDNGVTFRIRCPNCRGKSDEGTDKDEKEH